jgi:alpha-L-rhamnosidase
MYEYLAGIRPDKAKPGFKHIIMRPHIVPGLQYTDASYHSIRGKISSSWKNTPARLEWNILIPPNCTADVYIPAKELDQIYENDTPITDVKEIQFRKTENGYIIFSAGNGSYQFVVKYN